MPQIWDEGEAVERSRHATTAAVVCFVIPPDKRRQGEDGPFTRVTKKL